MVSGPDNNRKSSVIHRPRVKGRGKPEFVSVTNESVRFCFLSWRQQKFLFNGSTFTEEHFIYLKMPAV